MEPIIKAEEASVVYNLGKSNEAVALMDANIEIYPEEYIIFFGPSGCGKSTLLYSLIGLEALTKGKIEMMGGDISKLTSKEMIEFRRTGIGMVFQSFNLIPTLNVLDNITLPKIFGGEHPLQREKRAVYLCKVFGIEKLMHRFPGELSGGQQQRVAIARALIYSPLILMADEPVGNLDSQSADVAMKILDDLNQKQKKTIILVTHDPKHLHHAHRVFHMKDGMITQEVVNPEKLQVAKRKNKRRISIQLEKLARAFPTLSQRELQAKSLTNYLIQELNIDRVERLEDAVNSLILGKINEETFQKILNMPFIDGGIGLYKQTAEKYKIKVDVILKKARFLREGIKQEEEEAVGAKREMEDLARSLRIFLLDEYKGKITLEQLKKIDRGIEGRLLSALDRKQLERFLDAPLSEGGVGLNKVTARKFARKLEVVIAQTIQKQDRL